MKLLSIEEAQARFNAVCEEALAGEVIRLRHANGALLELLPISSRPEESRLSEKELAESYDDTDWAVFENHCAKASE